MSKNKIHITSYIISYTSIILQIIWWTKIYSGYQNKLYKNIFIIITPIYILTTSFFVFYLVNIFYNIIVPSKWLEQNSKYITYFISDETKLFIDIEKQYSRNNYIDNNIDIDNDIDNSLHSTPFNLIENDKYTPIILTIQIPVYLETFNDTLLPTYDNVLKHIRLYNSNPLSKFKINLLVCDDGYVHLTEKEQIERKKYYEEQDELFFIARPKKGRAGRFKKASNMNFSFRQIFQMDEQIKLGNSKKYDIEDIEDINYINDINNAWKSLSIQNDFVCKTNIKSSFKLGKYILLLDSDSKILLSYEKINELINELEINYNLGFLQLRTKADINSQLNMWENTIGYFTNNIYDINFYYSCSNGFPSPLVGHNCMLNVNVMKKVFHNSYGKQDKTYKIWDENRVSEDFIFSLQCQYIGYYGKYIYWDCGMTEGVTLNVLDEITKMEKYAYGVNELLFNPVNRWQNDGILTDVFTEFVVTDKINIPTKYAIFSYIGSYYALALSPVVTLLYYITTYIFHIINRTSAEYYVRSYINNPVYIIYSCFFIFFILSFITNIIIKWKHNINIQNGILYLIWIETYHGLRLCLFFSGLSYHLLVIILKHFLSYNVAWKMTNKETQVISIRTIVVEKYPGMYLIGTSLLLVILIGCSLPEPYTNKEIYNIAPLLSVIICSLISPIILC